MDRLNDLRPQFIPDGVMVQVIIQIWEKSRVSRIGTIKGFCLSEEFVYSAGVFFSYEYNVYLIDDVEDESGLVTALRQQYRTIFERELAGTSTRRTGWQGAVSRPSRTGLK